MAFSTIGIVPPLTVVAVALLMVLGALLFIPNLVAKTQIDGRLKPRQTVLLLLILLETILAVASLSYIAREHLNHAIILTYFIVSLVIFAVDAALIAIEM